MTKKLLIPVLLILQFFIVFNAVAQENFTVSKLLASPQEYVEKSVTVTGYRTHVTRYSPENFRFNLYETMKDKTVNMSPIDRLHTLKSPMLIVDISNMPKKDIFRVYRRSEELVVVEGIFKTKNNGYYIEAVNVAVIQSGSDEESNQTADTGIEKLTILMVVKASEHGDDYYKNNPSEYIAGVKNSRKIAKKLSNDNEIKGKILDRVDGTLKARKKRIKEEHTVLIEVNVYDAYYYSFGTFRIQPSGRVKIAEGRRDLKNMLMSIHRKTKGGREMLGEGEELLPEGMLYGSTDYDGIVNHFVEKAGEIIASYFGY